MKRIADWFKKTFTEQKQEEADAKKIPQQEPNLQIRSQQNFDAEYGDVSKLVAAAAKQEADPTLNENSVKKPKYIQPIDPKSEYGRWDVTLADKDVNESQGYGLMPTNQELKSKAPSSSPDINQAARSEYLDPKKFESLIAMPQVLSDINKRPLEKAAEKVITDRLIGTKNKDISKSVIKTFAGSILSQLESVANSMEIKIKSKDLEKYEIDRFKPTLEIISSQLRDDPKKTKEFIKGVSNALNEKDDSKRKQQLRHVIARATRSYKTEQTIELEKIIKTLGEKTTQNSPSTPSQVSKLGTKDKKKDHIQSL